MRNAFAVFAVVAALSLAPALACAENECGDGSVPKGTYPNCDPCGGAGSTQAAEDAATALATKMDAAAQPTAFDDLDKCFGDLLSNFFDFTGFSLPSIELCQIVRPYVQQGVNQLMQNVPTSYRNMSGFNVQDTSGQARAAAANLLK